MSGPPRIESSPRSLQFKHRLPSLALLAALCVLVTTQAAALDRDVVLQRSQAAIGRILGDFELLDRNGEPLQLSTLQGRPVLISVVYSSCVHSCSIATHVLDRAVQQARARLGAESFSVLTIGFDVPVDRPETMREFADRYRITDPDWHFLSAADAATIERLLDRLGFSYAPSAQGYDHIAQLTLLDAALRIQRQIYGESFDLPQLIEPLKDLVLNRPPSEQGVFERLRNRVRLLCTVYDPSGDRYVFDYSLFVGLFIGALVIAFGGVWLARETARTRAAR